MTMEYTMTTIGHVKSPYSQKFGIPRQAGLTPSLRSEVWLQSPYGNQESLRGLETCSHIWLLFLFHKTHKEGWKPTVRPPRLGGKKRLGVFATRSPHRPNPIGMSVVELHAVRSAEQHMVLEISNADLIDGTPIIDIKPYVPYADQQANADYPLVEKPVSLAQEIIFSPKAQQQAEIWSKARAIPLFDHISEVLRCDPRPAHLRHKIDREYGLSLYDLNIRWRINQHTIEVLSISDDIQLFEDD